MIESQGCIYSGNIMIIIVECMGLLPMPSYEGFVVFWNSCPVIILLMAHRAFIKYNCTASYAIILLYSPKGIYRI